MSEPAPRTRASRQRRLLAAFVVTLGLQVALLAWTPPDRHWQQAVLASAGLWLCWTIALRDLLGPPQTAPVLLVIAGWYLVQYVVPGFSSAIRPLDGRPLDDAALLQATQLAVAGLAAFALGLRARLTRGRLLDRVAWRMGELQRVRWPLLALGVLTLPVRLAHHDVLLHQVRGDGKPFQWLGLFFPLAAHLPLMCMGGLFVLALRRRLSGPAALASAAFGAFVLFTDLSTGLLAQAWSSALLLIFLFRLVRGRLPTGWLAAGMLVAVPLTMVKAQFRESTWNETGLSLVDRAGAFVALASRAASLDDLGEAAGAVAMRFNYLGVLARTAQLSPQPVPHWGGYTYQRLLWLPVPRVLYPEKPVVEVGQEFGHRYGLLEPDDRVTSFNLGQLVELFVNFGVVGVVGGMLLLGALVGLVSAELNRPDLPDACKVALAPALVWITFIEADFATVWGLALYMIPFQLLVMGALQVAVSLTTRSRAVAVASAR